MMAKIKVRPAKSRTHSHPVVVLGRFGRTLVTHDANEKGPKGVIEHVPSNDGTHGRPSEASANSGSEWMDRQRYGRIPTSDLPFSHDPPTVSKEHRALISLHIARQGPDVALYVRRRAEDYLRVFRSEETATLAAEMDLILWQWKSILQAKSRGMQSREAIKWLCDIKEIMRSFSETDLETTQDEQLDCS